MKNESPSVSFIICTLNSELMIWECLESVNNLTYPKDRITVLLMDGGSTDRTIEIATQYDFCKIHSVATDGPEEATAIGYNLSKSDYAINFASDNVIKDKNWLKRMIRPLEENSATVASETLRYTYVPDDKPLNKYFALFGMNDPLTFYLKKQDRSPYFETGWHLNTPVVNRGDYYETVFTRENMPTLGANGFVIRTKIIQKATKDPKKFSHIDTCVDLLDMGHTRYAFVKTDLWHKTGERFFNFFRKRRMYALTLYFNKQKMRRYHLYNPNTDLLKLVLFVVYSLTVIEPVFQSVRGYRKVKDAAWFLHPIVCFIITLNYAYVVIVHVCNNFYTNRK